MAMSARLKFRRHLAVSVCALLLAEIFGQFSGTQQQGRHERIKLAWASSEAQLQLGELPGAEADELGSLYQYDADGDTGFVERLLGELQQYLPVVDLNYTLNSASELTMAPIDAQVEQYYTERWPAANTSVDELQLLSVKAALRTAPIPLHTSWGYETREMASRASWPVQNDELCGAQLAHLVKRLEQTLEQSGAGDNGGQQAGAATSLEATPVENFEAKQVYQSRDVELFRYLDTFGRVPSDSLRGNVKWLGSYTACMATRLRAKAGRRTSAQVGASSGGSRPGSGRHIGAPPASGHAIKFRYCMGALKSLEWLRSEQTNERHEPTATRRLGVTTMDHKLGNFFIRIGLCLPEACDSRALAKRENQRAIERLAKFQLARPYNSDHYKFTDLYCLPDERSPLRTIPLLGKLLVLAILAWLSVIGLATTIHLNVDKFYTKTVEQIRSNSRAVNTLAAASSSLAKRPQSAVSSATEQADELSELRSAASSSAASTMSSNDDDDERNERNQFDEADFLELKLNWIKLNVWARDRARSLVPGVDLIECLSLYSNWLKYTRRVKVAVVRLYAHEQLNERKLRRNERLLPVHELERRATKVASKLLNGTELDEKQKRQTAAGGGEHGQRLQIDAAEAKRARRQADKWQQDDQLEAAFDLLLATGHQRPGASSNPQLRAAAKPARVDTSSLNALKVIALLWIIAGHCLYFLGSAVGNGGLLMLYTNKLASFALANGAIYITELFFIVTGCLTAYLSFKYNTRLVRLSQAALQQQSSGQTNATTITIELNERNNKTNAKSQKATQESSIEEKQLMEPRIFSLPFWALVTVNRYLRIVPAYLAVYAIIKLITIYVGGNGSLWDYAVSPNSVRRACVEESWLPVLTLTTNFIEVHKHCIVGGWYLSVDFQFALMAVPLLMLLARSQRATMTTTTTRKFGPLSGRLDESNLKSTKKELGDEANAFKHVLATVDRRVLFAYALIFAAALVSGILSILHAIYRSNVDLSIILKFVPHQVAMLSENISLYTNSIYRFRAFAAGLIVGHLLYLYEFKLINLPKPIQRHGTKLTVAIFAIGFGIMFVPVLYPFDKIRISHDVTAILTVVTAGGIDIFLCSLIFLVCIGKAPKAVLFALNSPFWSIFSALSLSAFLIHTEVIVLLTSQYEPPPNTRWSTLLFLFCTTVMITYTLALGFYLTFEMPFGRLVDAVINSYVLKWQPFRKRINANDNELEDEVASERHNTAGR